MALPAISPTGVLTPWIYPTQTEQGLGLSAAFGASPGSINPPMFFQPNRDLTDGRRELWIVATGMSSNWGGCQVHVSIDDASYLQDASIARSAVQGVLTADLSAGSDPDTTDTLSVDISMTSGGQIIAGTQQDADLLLSLAVIDTEVIAYTSATLTGAGLYDLGIYLRRGVYCTPISAHTAGAQFAILNGGVFVHKYPANLVGTVVYFKFPSFNTLGGELEDISTVPTYAWVIFAQPPEFPKGLTAQCEVCGTCASVVLQWDPNLSCDHVIFYHVFRAAGTGQPFSAATQVATVDALNWVDTGLQLGSSHTYYLLAENDDGLSSPSTGVNVTCAGGCVPAIDLGTQQVGIPKDGAISMWNVAAEPGTFPADFAGSRGYAQTAPSANATGAIKLIHSGATTTIGSYTFAAGSHDATFASTSHAAQSFVAGDVVVLVWPNPADATMADIALTLWASRDCSLAPVTPPPPPPIAVCPTPPLDGQILVWSAMENAYCPADLCALVAACSTFSVGAVSFQGHAFLWNFPAMSDSPEGAMSVWLKVRSSQLNPASYAPDLPNGDLFNNNLGYLMAGPPMSGFNNFFVAVGATVPFYGSDPSMRPVNPITNISSANPAVVTFALPHGIPLGANVAPIEVNQTGWGAFIFATFTVTAVAPTTATLDFNATGLPSYDPTETLGSPNALASLQVLNSFNVEVGNAFNYRATTPMAHDEWVNVLLSWKTDLSAGNKLLSLYYGDSAVSSGGSFPPGAPVKEGDPSSSFSAAFSTPSVSEIDSWMVGGTLAPNEFAIATDNPVCVICDMAELWFSTSQFIDFSNAANRAKFHDGSNRPVSLGADGSLPTGSAPILYQSVSGIAADPYAFLGLPLRFVNPQFNGATLAGSLMSSATFVCSFWVWGGGDHIVVHGSNGNRIEFDAIEGLVNVDLFDVSGTSEFNFTFPAPSTGDVFNIALAVDTNHTVGTKLVTARVDNVSAAVTVLVDNANSWLIDWTGPTGFVESNGFIADFWFGTGQFFDPLDKFMSAGGAWINIGGNGSGANGAQPDIYLSVRGTGPASDLATNLGSAGALTQGGPFVLVPDGAVFLKNRSGNRDLLLNSGFITFPLAPTHP